MVSNEVRILKKFAYTVAESVVKSLDGQIHPALDSNPRENNKKQFNKMPNKKKQNNLVVIDPNTKELMLSVPLRYKNSFYFSYLPDPVTLFLNLSHHSLIRIKELEAWFESKYKAGTLVWLTNENNFHQKKFGDVITIIVFSIMAIEALCNERLPENAIVSGKEMTKNQMEAKLALEKKLKVLKNQGIAIEAKLVERALFLKKLRDDIVHFKSFSHDLNKVKSVHPFDTILNMDVRKCFDEVSQLVESISPGRVQYLTRDAA